MVNSLFESNKYSEGKILVQASALPLNTHWYFSALPITEPNILGQSLWVNNQVNMPNPSIGSWSQ